jgi:NADH-quinone oxidoreductase subunit L
VSFELGLIPACPLAGFLILALFGARLSRGAVAAIGTGTVALSALFALHLAFTSFAALQAGGAITARIWTWWSVGNLAPAIAFHLDALSLVFVLVITFVGALIHLYATEYMRGEEGYARFFAYMNLFVGAMLILVLADNLLLLYLGWEGVGLCSYLLIGFWYRDPANGRAARKAFIVTRIGDVSMAVGLFLLFWNLGTLHISALLGRASTHWPVGSTLATGAALLLLGGAVGKSAQLPLQTWLPDAMAGPTPVSALIHAATMVTAGVYLVARMHAIFALAPAALTAVAVIGTLTLIIAGASALAQSDIKRVLAYSTISQIGYMFLALGVGAWSAAIFHFLTHAFFKALLFLGAGVVILALHHEQNLDRMGGLRRVLPITFATFLVGAASLAALPLVTAGFYSKDLILWEAWASPRGSAWLWAGGLVGALITALYSFRLVIRVFGGALPARSEHSVTGETPGAGGAPAAAEHSAVVEVPAAEGRPGGPGAAMLLPLVVLAVLALFGGLIEIPATLGGHAGFSRFLDGVFAPHPHGATPAEAAPIAHAAGHGEEALLQIVAALTTIVGILSAYLLFLRRPGLVRRWLGARAGARVRSFLHAGWGFDWLYERLFVRPFVWLAQINRNDAFDAAYTGLAASATAAHGALARTQNGRLRLYAMAIAAGAIVIIAILVLA